MSRVTDYTGVARRLAERARDRMAPYADRSYWVQGLVKKVDAAGDDDLGTLLVAGVVLTQVDEARTAQEVAHRAAEEERHRQVEAQTARGRREAVARRRRERAGRLRGQLIARLLLGAGYCGLVALLAALPTISWTRFVAGLPGIGALCAALVAASLVFDWFAFSDTWSLAHRDPAGPLRVVCVVTGLVIGLMPWVRTLVQQWNWPALSWGVPLGVGPLTTNWVAATAPLAITVGWVVGGALEMLADAAARVEVTFGAEGVRKAVLVLVAIGPVGSVSLAVLASVPRAYARAAAGLGRPNVVPQWNPLGVWAHPYVLVVLGMLALAVHIAAPAIRDAWPFLGNPAYLGYFAYYLAPALGVLTLFVNPLNIVTWLVDAALRAVT
jgi:hypothetical protein